MVLAAAASGREVGATTDPKASLAPTPATTSSTSRDRAGTDSVRRIMTDGNTPTIDGTAERIVCGIRIIAHRGVSPAAIDQCADVVRLEIGNNAYAQEQLSKKRTTLVVIPASERMTLLPEFLQLAGEKTPDGRGWENVRGSGGMQIPDGSFALAVPEENLVAVHSAFAGYGPGYSVGMHEFAHTLQDAGMTGGQATRVTQMYEARHALAVAKGSPHDIFTDTYAATNEKEYFAQSTDCFFSRNKGEGANGRDWLAAHDPDMYEFLVELYEHSHDKHGKDTGPV